MLRILPTKLRLCMQYRFTYRYSWLMRPGVGPAVLQGRAL